MNFKINNWRVLISIIFSVFIFVNCAGKARKPAPKPIGQISPHFEISLRLADSLWANRTNPDNALDALYAYEYLAQKDSTNLPIWSKLVHAYYFYAEYIQSQNQVRRDSLFGIGYNITREMLKRSKPYQSVMVTAGDPLLALKSLESPYEQILYWGTACLAQWSATKGEIVQRGQRKWIFAALNQIHDLDSTFYFGGYDRFMGALLCVDPAAGQNAPDEARKYFDVAREIAPDYLGTYILEARYYAPLVQDEALFNQLLATVRTAELDLKKPYGPENYFEKRRCEYLELAASEKGWFNKQ